MLAKFQSRAPILALLFILGCAHVSYAQDDLPPDEVLLKNGSRVVGKVTAVRAGVVSVETDFAGVLAIDLAQVESISTRDPVVMQLANDTVIREQPLRVEQEQVFLAGEGEEPAQNYALEELLLVNPEPWELGNGYKWSGVISFAWILERGNRDTDELDYKLETEWLSTRDRYNLKLVGENDETNDETTADNWLISGNYHRFFGANSDYWGILASAESDEFIDLDLRALVGPVLGRDFLTDPLFTLSAEVGAAYVHEDFIVAEDQDYGAANWSLRMGSNYLGGDSRLYLNQRGIWSLEDTSDVVVDTTIGLAFPLKWGLEAAAEILLEYDSGAQEDVEDMDQTYKVRIGYTW